MLAMDLDAVHDARRRFRRYNTVFWLSIAAIPLGLIVPCLLSIVAYKIWGDEVSAPVALSGLFWPLVGLAGALLVRGARARSRRSLQLAELAQRVGLRFIYLPKLEQFRFLHDVSFMADPHFSSAKNWMDGTPNGREMIALDYEYTYTWGSVSEVGSQTMVVFRGFEHLPPMGIIPIGIMGRLENFLLGDRNKIPFADPRFTSQFVVVGDDYTHIAATITPTLIDTIINDRLLTSVAEQGMLIIFRRLTYVAASDYQAFLAEAFRVAELLSPPRRS
jgi:hypothetical protein